MTALRFCMLTTFYPPYNFGGDGIAVQRLAEGLVRAGHHVTVVHDVDAYHALHPEPPPSKDIGTGGVEVVPLRSGLGPLSPLLTQQMGRPVLNGRRIRGLLARGRFDVVNFHNVSLIGGPGLLAYGGDAVRVYMAHEHWLVCPTHVLWRHKRELCDRHECFRCSLKYRRPPQLWRYSGYLRRQLRNVDAFIAMSEFSRDKHREHGFPVEMEVLPGFLNSSASSTSSAAPEPAPHARPYFLFVGRLEQAKGLDDVIPLFRRYPDADLLIAGEGSHGPALRALAEASPRVRFLGNVSPDALRAYYAGAIALLVPSVCYETFGIILIESMSQGSPVIARRLGPFPEIIRQSNAGLLFSTAEELLAAMSRVQHEPGLRAGLAAAGRHAFQERWSESVVIPRYLDVVRRAAARRGSARVARALSTLEVA
ncbi:MAG TPA: glycosyltransferase family 4 protein [Gemmatimonadaceae bacterium]